MRENGEKLNSRFALLHAWPMRAWFVGFKMKNGIIAPVEY